MLLLRRDLGTIEGASLLLSLSTRLVHPRMGAASSAWLQDRREQGVELQLSCSGQRNKRFIGNHQDLGICYHTVTQP